MLQSEKIDQIGAALVKAQASFPKIGKATKGQIGPREYLYADLADILEAVRPALKDSGIAIAQSPNVIDGQPVLETRLIHTSGQWIGAVYRMSVQGTPQQVGSEITYARRYSLSAILGIAADEDDDGHGASQGNQTRATAPPRQAPKQPAPPRSSNAHEDLADVEQVGELNDLIERTATPANKIVDFVKKTFNAVEVKGISDFTTEQREAVIAKLRAKANGATKKTQTPANAGR